MRPSPDIIAEEHRMAVERDRRRARTRVATLPDLTPFLQESVLWLILASLLLTWISAVPARAERIFMDDGTVVEGELVGYEGGNYKVKMGRFVKIIPDARITDIKASEAGADVRPAPAAPAGTMSYGGDAYGSGTPARSPGQDPEDVLRAALGDAGVSDPNSISQSDAVQQTMNMLLGGRSSVSESDMDEINQNPQVQKLMKTYTDRSYQQSLLEAAERMQEQLAPGEENPHIETLRSLFDQLNGASTSR